MPASSLAWGFSRSDGVLRVLVDVPDKHPGPRIGQGRLQPRRSCSTMTGMGAPRRTPGISDPPSLRPHRGGPAPQRARRATSPTARSPSTCSGRSTRCTIAHLAACAGLRACRAFVSGRAAASPARLANPERPAALPGPRPRRRPDRRRRRQSVNPTSGVGPRDAPLVSMVVARKRAAQEAVASTVASLACRIAAGFRDSAATRRKRRLLRGLWRGLAGADRLRAVERRNPNPPPAATRPSRTPAANTSRCCARATAWIPPSSKRPAGPSKMTHSSDSCMRKRLRAIAKHQVPSSRSVSTAHCATTMCPIARCFAAKPGPTPAASTSAAGLDLWDFWVTLGTLGWSGRLLLEELLQAG